MYYVTRLFETAFHDYLILTSGTLTIVKGRERPMYGGQGRRGGRGRNGGTKNNFTLDKIPGHTSIIM